MRSGRRGLPRRTAALAALLLIALAAAVGESAVAGTEQSRSAIGPDRARAAFESGRLVSLPRIAKIMPAGLLAEYAYTAKGPQRVILARILVFGSDARGRDASATCSALERCLRVQNVVLEMSSDIGSADRRALTRALGKLGKPTSP